MGFLNIAAGTPSDALSKIVAWATGSGAGQLGMTLEDTITPGMDVVVSTQGVGGARPKLYIRITASVLAKSPTDAGSQLLDNVTFRLYRSWNAGTHTGKGEAGRFGPRVWA